MNPEILAGAIAGSRLVEDYIAGEERARRFFPSDPRDPAALEAKLADLNERLPPASRRRLANAIRPGSERAAAKLESILRGEGYVVTTGQQPGLFLGPLYTIHKLLSCVRLAGLLEERLQCPVAPLFWIASDDHDWQEANHVHILDTSNEIVRLELQGDPDEPPRSLRQRVLGAEVSQLIQKLGGAVPPNEFAAEVLADVRGAYTPERSLPEAYQELLVRWLGRFDILVVDAGHPDVKRESAALLESELRDQAKRENALAERAAALEAAGYDVQVPILPAAANVFLEDGEGRERLVRGEAGTWTLRRSAAQLTDDELHALLASSPARFSPNVLLRPVVESGLFPTLAYVGGPGEVAYLAQTGPLFDAAGIRMPFVVPRSSVLLVEGKVRKVLDKFGLTPDAVRRPMHEVASELLRDEVPESIRATLAELRETIAAGYERLEGPVLEIDPTLARPLRGARNESLAPLQDVERKVVQHLKQRNATGLQQLEKARTNLFPGGVPQERVLSAAPYLVRYGKGLLDSIAASVEVAAPAGPAGAEAALGLKRR